MRYTPHSYSYDLKGESYSYKAKQHLSKGLSHISWSPRTLVKSRRYFTFPLDAFHNLTCLHGNILYIIISTSTIKLNLLLCNWTMIRKLYYILLLYRYDCVAQDQYVSVIFKLWCEFALSPTWKLISRWIIAVCVVYYDIFILSDVSRWTIWWPRRANGVWCLRLIITTVKLYSNTVKIKRNITFFL